MRLSPCLQRMQHCQQQVLQAAPTMYHLVNCQTLTIQSNSSFSFFVMESILHQIANQQVWEEYLACRLKQGRLNWREFDELDSFVEQKQYLPTISKLLDDGLSIPTKKLINKSGTDKKRVVYTYPNDEMLVLKVIAFLLYKYDNIFASNCYAFRKNITAHDAVIKIQKAVRGKRFWAYKTDIHNYFNSLDISLLLPMLSDIFSDDKSLYDFFEKMLTNKRVNVNGVITEEESKGVMAGTPTASFLANVYLMKVDKYFEEKGVIYARYSDDIIIFAPNETTLQEYKNTLFGFFNEYHLEINPKKEKTYTPDDGFEFLGFKCQEDKIDISSSTKAKIKGKIRRKAHALMRWRTKHNVSAEKAIKGFIKSINIRFYESDDPETLNWSRWFFPVINQTEGLKEIDHYIQQNIRYLTTGKHNKSNYRTKYSDIKRLGYRSLVNEFYKHKNT